MHPDHHNKLIAISAGIIIVVVLVLGLAIVVWNRNQGGTEATPTVQKSEYETLLDSTTASRASSMSDPVVQELNESTSASRSGSNGQREVLIQATSKDEN